MNSHVSLIGGVGAGVVSPVCLFNVVRARTTAVYRASRMLLSMRHIVLVRFRRCHKQRTLARIAVYHKRRELPTIVRSSACIQTITRLHCTFCKLLVSRNVHPSFTAPV